MRRVLCGGFLVALLGAPLAGPAAEPPPAAGPPAAPPPAGVPVDPDVLPPGEPAAPPPIDPMAPLEPTERDTLMRLAWQTLTGHLTRRPITDADLLAYELTPRLMAPRGVWITIRKDGSVRGSQGEIEAGRPLFQQVIVYVRRAATRDPRFIPLTDLDLDSLRVEIAVIGRRERVDGPESLDPAHQGVLIEKWGRRAMFLPGVGASQGWSARRTLDELCRNASLPEGAWQSGARIESFAAEIFEAARPAPAAPAGPAPPGGDPPAAATPAE
ncbi:MAG: AmmeMemoRadiSam system protein A [Candidatus Polarisedimenticolia bacterium]